MGITNIDDKIINKAISAFTLYNKEKTTLNSEEQSELEELQRYFSEKHNNSKSFIQYISEKYEKIFWEELISLNVQRPNCVTRVSEHIEDIHAFISALLSNQSVKDLAYISSDNSIYFNTSQYIENISQYPIPSPSNSKSSELPTPDTNPPPSASSSSSSSSSNNNSNSNSNSGISRIETIEDSEMKDKKHPNDFVLWKSNSTRDHELLHAIGASWKTPQTTTSITINNSSDSRSNEIETKEYGRPGWHIECSVMCKSTFGDELDVHAGGIDLLFPHHSNEVAQCVAHQHSVNVGGETENYQWPNYFFHVGHLYIRGCKMSKSLKNFIKVKDFLSKYTANEFRIFCMKHHYRSNVDYSEAEMQEVQAILNKFTSFFTEMKYNSSLFITFQASSKSDQLYPEKWSSYDHDLHDYFRSVEGEINFAFKDDFDTPKALQLLLSLISHYYKVQQQLRDSQANTSSPSSSSSSSSSSSIMYLSPTLTLSVTNYITSMLQIMGLDISQLSISQSSSGDSSLVDSQLVDQLAEELVNLRIEIRKILLEKSTSEGEKRQALFKFCDYLRDVRAPSIGIEIQDRTASSCSWSWKNKIRGWLKRK